MTYNSITTPLCRIKPNDPLKTILKNAGAGLLNFAAGASETSSTNLIEEKSGPSLKERFVNYFSKKEEGGQKYGVSHTEDRKYLVAYKPEKEVPKKHNEAWNLSRMAPRVSKKEEENPGKFFPDETGISIIPDQPNTKFLKRNPKYPDHQDYETHKEIVYGVKRYWLHHPEDVSSPDAVSSSGGAHPSARQETKEQLYTPRLGKHDETLHSLKAEIAKLQALYKTCENLKKDYTNSEPPLFDFVISSPFLRKFTDRGDKGQKWLDSLVAYENAVLDYQERVMTAYEQYKENNPPGDRKPLDFLECLVILEFPDVDAKKMSDRLDAIDAVLDDQLVKIKLDQSVVKDLKKITGKSGNQWARNIRRIIQAIEHSGFQKNDREHPFSSDLKKIKEQLEANIFPKLSAEQSTSVAKWLQDFEALIHVVENGEKGFFTPQSLKKSGLGYSNDPEEKPKKNKSREKRSSWSQIDVNKYAQASPRGGGRNSAPQTPRLISASLETPRLTLLASSGFSGSDPEEYLDYPDPITFARIRDELFGYARNQDQSEEKIESSESLKHEQGVILEEPTLTETFPQACHNLLQAFNEPTDTLLPAFQTWKTIFRAVQQDISEQSQELLQKLFNLPDEGAPLRTFVLLNLLRKDIETFNLSYINYQKKDKGKALVSEQNTPGELSQEIANIEKILVQDPFNRTNALKDALAELLRKQSDYLEYLELSQNSKAQPLKENIETLFARMSDILTALEDSHTIKEKPLTGIDTELYKDFLTYSPPDLLRIVRFAAEKRKEPADEILDKIGAGEHIPEAIGYDPNVDNVLFHLEVRTLKRKIRKKIEEEKYNPFPENLALPKPRSSEKITKIAKEIVTAKHALARYRGLLIEELAKHYTFASEQEKGEFLHKAYKRSTTNPSPFYVDRLLRLLSLENADLNHPVIKKVSLILCYLKFLEITLAKCEVFYLDITSKAHKKHIAKPSAPQNEEDWEIFHISKEECERHKITPADFSHIHNLAQKGIPNFKELRAHLAAINDFAKYGMRNKAFHKALRKITSFTPSNHARAFLNDLLMQIIKGVPHRMRSSLIDYRGNEQRFSGFVTNSLKEKVKELDELATQDFLAETTQTYKATIQELQDLIQERRSYVNKIHEIYATTQGVTVKNDKIERSKVFMQETLPDPEIVQKYGDFLQKKVDPLELKGFDPTTMTQSFLGSLFGDLPQIHDTTYDRQLKEFQAITLVQKEIPEAIKKIEAEITQKIEKLDDVLNKRKETAQNEVILAQKIILCAVLLFWEKESSIYINFERDSRNRDYNPALKRDEIETLLKSLNFPIDIFKPEIDALLFKGDFSIEHIKMWRKDFGLLEEDPTDEEETPEYEREGTQIGSWVEQAPQKLGESSQENDQKEPEYQVKERLIEHSIQYYKRALDEIPESLLQDLKFSSQRNTLLGQPTEYSPLLAPTVSTKHVAENREAHDIPVVEAAMRVIQCASLALWHKKIERKAKHHNPQTIPEKIGKELKNFFTSHPKEAVTIKFREENSTHEKRVKLLKKKLKIFFEEDPTSWKEFERAFKPEIERAADGYFRLDLHLTSFTSLREGAKSVYNLALNYGKMSDEDLKRLVEHIQVMDENDTLFIKVGQEVSLRSGMYPASPEGLKAKRYAGLLQGRFSASTLYTLDIEYLGTGWRLILRVNGIDVSNSLDEYPEVANFFHETAIGKIGVGLDLIGGPINVPSMTNKKELSYLDQTKIRADLSLDPGQGTYISGVMLKFPPNSQGRKDLIDFVVRMATGHEIGVSDLKNVSLSVPSYDTIYAANLSGGIIARVETPTQEGLKKAGLETGPLQEKKFWEGVGGQADFTVWGGLLGKHYNYGNPHGEESTFSGHHEIMEKEIFGATYLHSFNVAAFQRSWDTENYAIPCAAFSKSGATSSENAQKVLIGSPVYALGSGYDHFVTGYRLEQKRSKDRYKDLESAAKKGKGHFLEPLNPFTNNRDLLDFLECDIIPGENYPYKGNYYEHLLFRKKVDDLLKEAKNEDFVNVLCLPSDEMKVLINRLVDQSKALRRQGKTVEADLLFERAHKMMKDADTYVPRFIFLVLTGDYGVRLTNLSFIYATLDTYATTQDERFLCGIEIPEIKKKEKKEKLKSSLSSSSQKTSSHPVIEMETVEERTLYLDREGISKKKFNSESNQPISSHSTPPTPRSQDTVMTMPPEVNGKSSLNKTQRILKTESQQKPRRVPILKLIPPSPDNKEGDHS